VRTIRYLTAGWSSCTGRDHPRGDGGTEQFIELPVSKREGRSRQRGLRRRAQTNDNLIGRIAAATSRPSEGA